MYQGTRENKTFLGIKKLGTSLELISGTSKFLKGSRERGPPPPPRIPPWEALKEQYHFFHVMCEMQLTSII